MSSDESNAEVNQKQGNARIVGNKFLFDCSCGSTTNVDLLKLSSAAVGKANSIVLNCHRPSCDRVFELSDEFRKKLQEKVDDAE